MTENITQPKRQILRSILYTVLILFFPIAAGVAAAIMKTDEQQTMLIQALFFAFAFGVAILISKNVFGNVSSVGLKAPKSLYAEQSLYFIPLLVTEILPLFWGLQKGLSLGTVLLVLLWSIFVALAEETFFRGIILSLLKSKSLVLAIILSSFLFSLGHLANLAGGADPIATLGQVLFAFSFGLVAAIITLYTQSLLVPILLHFAHNTIATLTVTAGTSADLILGCVQAVILLIYAYYLWKKNNSLVQENTK